MERLLRVTCWVLRFVGNIRIKEKANKNLIEYVTVEERKYAFNLWLKSNQRQLLTTANYESLKLSVNLVEEEDGIIRAHGRVQQKKLPVEMRKPVMLERNHKITELILWDCHR